MSRRKPLALREMDMDFASNQEVAAAALHECHGWIDQYFRKHACPDRALTSQYRCAACNLRPKKAHLVYRGEYDGGGA